MDFAETKYFSLVSVPNTGIAIRAPLHTGLPANLFTKVGPLQSNHTDVDSVGDEGLVVHEFVGGEGGDRVQEELCRLLEVPDGHAVQSLVDLQTVPPVPVTSLLNKAVERRTKKRGVLRCAKGVWMES